MKGKYYAVYDMKDEEVCIGVFESIEEICTFFGGIRRNRVECAITRKNPLAFKAKRYWVSVFKEPTKHSVRGLLRQKYGTAMYKICPDGIFIRRDGCRGWQLLASDYVGVIAQCVGQQGGWTE